MQLSRRHARRTVCRHWLLPPASLNVHCYAPLKVNLVLERFVRECAYPQARNQTLWPCRPSIPSFRSPCRRRYTWDIASAEACILSRRSRPSLTRQAGTATLQPAFLSFLFWLANRQLHYIHARSVRRRAHRYCVRQEVLGRAVPPLSRAHDRIAVALALPSIQLYLLIALLSSLLRGLDWQF